MDAMRVTAPVASLRSEVLHTARARRASHDAAFRRVLAAGDANAVLLALAIAMVLDGRPGSGHRMIWVSPSYR